MFLTAEMHTPWEKPCMPQPTIPTDAAFSSDSSLTASAPVAPVRQDVTLFASSSALL